MKRSISLLLFIFFTVIVIGQCSSVSVQISSSDTTYVQLYNAGFFNIPSGFDNICEWKINSFSGEIIHQETTMGQFNDLSNSYFEHTTPITDSMKASIIITNSIEGITCTMNDTLYWKETEVLPGAIIGNWDVLSSNGGVEEELSNSSRINQNINNITIFPSSIDDHFSIQSDLDVHSFTIFDFTGKTVAIHNNVKTLEWVDISFLSRGIYFVQFIDENSNPLIIKKIVKN